MGQRRKSLSSAWALLGVLANGRGARDGFEQHSGVESAPILGTEMMFQLANFFFFCLFAISWAAPAAYGGSQATGQIEAVATGHARTTATQDPSCICNLHHSSWQRRILNPLSKGRDRTRNLMVPIQIR